MSQHITYLNSHPQITDVLAQGFANIYHHKPQFPVSFLAQFLKSHTQQQKQKSKLLSKIQNDNKIINQFKQNDQKQAKRRQQERQKHKTQLDRQQAFQFRIKQANNHEEYLNAFCDWLEKERGFTGVYIGELQSATKKIDLDKEDGEEAHIDGQAPKQIVFKAASYSHVPVVIGKTLALQSVVGKLITQKPQQAGGEEEQGKEKVNKPKGEIYIPLVQQNNQLSFFRYPRLGSFYAISMKVKTYLYQKVFDSSIVKTQDYRKTKQEYDKQFEERQQKFRTAYDQRAGAGADQKQLEQLQANNAKQQQNFPKPKLQQFQYVLRQFVVCFDTLGLDRQIPSEQQAYCRRFVQFLRTSWEEKQLQLLTKDIDSQIKLIADNADVSMQDTMTQYIEEQDKQLPHNEEVEKVKDKEKLMELQINTLRIQKIKQHIADQKYISILDNLLNRRVIKYSQILKIFYLFADNPKQSINFPNTNILNWFKASKIMTKQQIFQKINEYIPRGSKPDVVVRPYAKWQRVLKNLQKYDVNAVATYNIYLAFILRFLVISGKVRIADKQARRQVIKNERLLREQKKKQAERKTAERAQKLQVAKEQAAGKEEEGQHFDEEAWLKTYDQENPVVEIGEEIMDQADNDLEDIPEAAAE